jgi:hypothetical protein
VDTILHLHELCYIQLVRLRVKFTHKVFGAVAGEVFIRKKKKSSFVYINFIFLLDFIFI